LHSLPPGFGNILSRQRLPVGNKYYESRRIVAAVQIADLLVRHSGIGNSGNAREISQEVWLHASGWDILLPHQREPEKAIAHASFKRSLERLPTILEGLV
jgi:hypothetical protein